MKHAALCQADAFPPNTTALPLKSLQYPSCRHLSLAITFDKGLNEGKTHRLQHYLHNYGQDD